MHNNCLFSSLKQERGYLAIADMAAQSCTIQNVTLKCGIPIFNAFFSVSSENIPINHILPKTRFYGLNFCYRQYQSNAK